MKRLRIPPPMVFHSRIERSGADDLLKIFRAGYKPRPNKAEYELLAGAWGGLFSKTYLSAEEMVDEMDRGEGRFSEDDDRMLRDFIRADCAGGGPLVLEIIRNGANIDRAALILFAEIEDLAGVEQNGIMALQLLIEACDKKVRPVLIKKAGQHYLSRVYDKRGLPLIFSIYSLCDVQEEDLDAIASIFTRDELSTIMSRSRTGNTALDVFNSVAAAIRRYPSHARNAALVRNPFYLSAAKDAPEDEPEKAVKIKKLSSPSKNDPQG